MQLTANWSESKAWATYRLIQKQYAALIGDLKPIALSSRDAPAPFVLVRDQHGPALPLASPPVRFGAQPPLH